MTMALRLVTEVKVINAKHKVCSLTESLSSYGGHWPGSMPVTILGRPVRCSGVGVAVLRRGTQVVMGPTL